MSRALPALVLLAATAGGAGKDPWVRIVSPHFEVFTDAGERAGRDVARQFEQVHGFFAARFQHGIDPERKARVILFRNQKEYPERAGIRPRRNGIMSRTSNRKDNYEILYRRTRVCRRGLRTGEPAGHDFEERLQHR
jgi:hypothetical protein